MNSGVGNLMLLSSQHYIQLGAFSNWVLCNLSWRNNANISDVYVRKIKNWHQNNDRVNGLYQLNNNSVTLNSIAQHAGKLCFTDVLNLCVK